LCINIPENYFSYHGAPPYFFLFQKLKTND
jgi:hypothetical protein